MKRFSVLLLSIVMLGQVAEAKNPFSLISFRRSETVAKSSNLLTQENGPWMIFVAAFAGNGAESEARELVEMLNTKLKVRAYLHKKNYDFTDDVKGKGFDQYGRPKRMRFSSEGAFEEFAVLVGDFNQVDDPDLQKQLRIIKFATKEELGLRSNGKAPTTRRYAGLRALQNKIRGKSESRVRGPLGNAFATRNPMIPREAVAPVGLDERLIESNKRRKYTLLKNPGKYTVRVASFRGEVVIDQKKIQEIESQQRSLSRRIDQTDDKAEALARILRNKGVEAYVFHDYHESIVTVGSFNEIGHDRPDGRIELNPDVARIITAYGPEKKSIPGAQIPIAGIQPKAVDGGSQLGKLIFDVAPQPILVPRKSIATDYRASSRPKFLGGI